MTLLSVLNICDAMIRDYQGDEDKLLSNELASCVDMAYDHVDERDSEHVDVPGVGAAVNEDSELGMLVKLYTALVAPDVMFLEYIMFFLSEKIC